MALEVALVAFLVFALGAATTMLIHAKRRKHRAPWLFLALIFFTISAGSVLGLLDYYRDDPEQLQETFRVFYVITPFAWIIAVFLLSRSNYEDRLEKQYLEISALNELARSYIASDELSEAARSALLKVARAFGADGGQVLTLDWLRKRIEVVASFGEIPDSVVELVDDLNARLATGGLPLEEIAKGRTVMEEMMRLGEAMRRDDGFSSLLGKPIMFRKRATGMFLLFSRRPTRMTKQDDAIFTLVAFELGFWLEQVRNIASLRRLSESQKGLLDVALTLQQEIALDEEELVRHVLERLNRLIPSLTISLYLYDEAKGLLFPAAALGKEAREIMAEGEFPLSEGGLAGAILRSGKAEIIHDAKADGRAVVVNGTSDEPTSMLVVPLISGRRAIGVLELHRPVQETFLRHELELASLFAQQAATAIENANLLAVMELEKERAELYLDLLSHDIANLNTPLISYFDMAREMHTVDEVKGIVEKAFPQVEKINALLSRVRKLSRADLDEPERLKEVDLVGLLREVEETLRAAFPQRQLRMTVTTKDERGRHPRSGEMLDEILFNILHNAIKFSPQEEAVIEIEIGAEETDRGLFSIITVKDYGRGVSDQDKRRIFEKERPLAASYARGYGIGLATCRKFLEKYGGELWVEDRVRGDHTQGACFVLELPIYAEGQP